MLQTPGKPNPMTCADFEACFDQYVDETLDAATMNSCSCHIASCRPCDKEVTRWQQTRILLSTAVADFSTAVDVSSVRGDVFAALGFAEEDAAPRRQGAGREAAFDRGPARRSAGRPARRAASGERHGVFGAALRFTSAATVSAVAAAFAVMVLSPSQVHDQAPPDTVAAVAKPKTFSTWMPTSEMFKPAAATYSAPPLARPEVSHVDGLEAAPGQRASTWVQPRTNARVIWVEADNGNGAPVRTVGLRR